MEHAVMLNVATSFLQAILVDLQCTIPDLRATLSKLQAFQETLKRNCSYPPCWNQLFNETYCCQTPFPLALRCLHFQFLPICKGQEELIYFLWLTTNSNVPPLGAETAVSSDLNKNLKSVQLWATSFCPSCLGQTPTSHQVCAMLNWKHSSSIHVVIFFWLQFMAATQISISVIFKVPYFLSVLIFISVDLNLHWKPVTVSLFV